MRPEDALGGLLRANQIVVVGDARQLPPTDFFSRADRQDGADEEIDDVDAELILEACERTFGQRRRLKWHYRSRCESLIAFSNASSTTRPHYLPDGKARIVLGRLVRVNGVYRGSATPPRRTSGPRSDAFMRHFADARMTSCRRLDRRRKHPAARLHLGRTTPASADDELVEKYRERVEDKGEPLFVKNLENVQGDERDYIFISMTYGKKRSAHSPKTSGRSTVSRATVVSTCSLPAPSPDRSLYFLRVR